MRSLRLTAIAALIPAGLAAQSTQPITDQYRDAATRILQAAQADSAAWNRLAELTDRFGPRLSGSDNLAHALDWILGQMRADSLENVRGEAVMVPHWVRGAESADLVEPRPVALAMAGLGGSIGTPRGGITAPVLVVNSFEDLEHRAAEARGKIVLFDVPFTDYGATVRYRVDGAIAAARAGAVASLIRSVSSGTMRNVHTGVMRYDSTVRQIPHAAIAVEDAAMIHRMADRGQRVVIHLVMSGRMLPDAPSKNVIAELRGRELPGEVVVMGGHTDSWDIAPGAMDDGGGVVAAWQALRVLERLGLRPRRTIRVVGWVNEENGSRGGDGYRAAHGSEVHVLGIESDNGVFHPQGVGFSGSDSARAVIRQIAHLLAPIGADSVGPSGGGADVGPLAQLGVPTMSPEVDETRYFWYHHSAADTVDKLDPADVNRCVAVMAIMAYVVADLPARLPHARPATGQ